MLETCFPYGLMHAAHVDMSLGKMRASDGMGKKAKKDAAPMRFATSDGKGTGGAEADARDRGVSVASDGRGRTSEHTNE